MTRCFCDLHIHTVYSDGGFTPEKVVRHAKAAGLNLIAVTDHDTVEGCKELAAVAATEGIRSVAGIEVSAYCGETKFHTLGYGMDEKALAPFLKRLYDGSVVRRDEIIFKLNKLGYDITTEDVDGQRFSLSSPVHVMHIARAIAAKGYASSPQEAFFKFLVCGKPAHSCAERPTPEEACRAIASAGGIAVLAHPARISMGCEELKQKILSLKDWGLSGIEAYYTTHTKEQTAYYKELADRLGLIVTGGSDTHFDDGGRKIGFPRFEAGSRLLERLCIE